jgi:hypothetical protein
VEVLAAVQPLDDLHEPDRLDVVHAAGARVVAFLRRVAGDARMLRTPSACAPSRSDSSPEIVVSRGSGAGSSRARPSARSRRRS